MSRQGLCSHGPFISIPLNEPPLLDLPSTSNQKNQTLPNDKKLSLYGPLSIPDYEEFIKKQKILFPERYAATYAQLKNLNDYECLYILGRGDYSKLVVAQGKTERKFYVLKIYQKHLLVKKNLVQNILEEKRILQSLDCPYCIRLENVYQDFFELTFVLPFISGGELFTLVQRNSKFDEDASAFYAAQVVLALEYLHSCNVVHRDLKPENLRLDHLGYLKIVKFRFAKVVTTRTYTFCGTPEYIAPEMIAGKGYNNSVDWWALGILLFEMNTGHPPFISQNHMRTYKNITAARYSTPNNFSPDLRDLIGKLLQPDVSKRAGNLKRGPEEIKSHKWFKGVNWTKLINRQLNPPFPPDTHKTKMNYPDLASCSRRDLKANNVDEYFKEF